MSRISQLTNDEVPPETCALYERITEQRGHVPRMFRVMAHRPEIFRTMVDHLDAVTHSGTVPRKTKELVVVLVSRLNGCAY